MARHLTDADIQSICEIVDGWDPKTPLTWDALTAAAEGLLGHRYTRQALNARDRIKTAYSVRNKVLRSLVERAPQGSVELQAAQARIDGLKAENQRLKVENERLLAQFVRWLYNASLKGLDKEKLNAPLPGIDRERTRVTVIDENRRNSRNREG
jgi:hypothetical protein